MGRDVLEHLRQLRAADPELQAEYDRLAPGYELANSVLRARLRAGLTNTELARRMGVSYGTVLRMQSGEHTPRLETLRRACEVLGCRLDVRIVPERQQRKSA
jgi:ribosome-binding protein aMBF1 (putative translation factor)